MKKTSLLVVALLAIVGCNKEESFPIDYQEVSIYIKGVESGDITKVSGSSVTLLIESLFPSTGVLIFLLILIM